MIASAFSRALAQLSDPALRRALWLGLLAAAGTLLALWGGFVWLIGSIEIVESDWDDWLDAGAAVLALIPMVLLYPSAVLIAASLLAEPVARAVEARHYPDLPPPRPQPVSEGIVAGLRLTGFALILNLIALPLYLLPGPNIVIWLLVNGWLIGREFYETVALRRLEPAEMKRLRKRHFRRLLPTGMIAAFALSIPLVNLLAPVVVLAAMTHVTESIRRATG